MARRSFTILAVLLAMLFAGCASSYRPLRPESMKYSDGKAGPGLASGYHFDVLTESGNKKYAKHERNMGIKLVAVKVTNQTQESINGKDLTFAVGALPAKPIEPSEVKWKLGQGVPIYLLYLLFTPMSINIYNSNGTVDQYPVGYALGPGLTLINMLTAANANAKFANDLTFYSLNREIKPGQSLVFLLAFEGVGYEPVTVSLKE